MIVGELLRIMSSVRLWLLRQRMANGVSLRGHDGEDPLGVSGVMAEELLAGVSVAGLGLVEEVLGGLRLALVDHDDAGGLADGGDRGHPLHGDRPTLASIPVRVGIPAAALSVAMRGVGARARAARCLPRLAIWPEHAGSRR